MALFTKKGYDNILQRIWETGGMTPDMEDDIRRLRDEFDEREGILREYGEEYDGEQEEYEFRRRNQESVISDTGSDVTEITDTEETISNTDDRVELDNKPDWESRYRKLEQRYKDTFFGRMKPDDDFSEIMEDQISNAVAESAPRSFNELLYSTKNETKGD